MAHDDATRAIVLDADVSSLRIGIVAPPWVPVPPVDYGGTEVIIDALALGFARAGHDVQLFTTGDATCPVTRRWHHPHAEGTTAPLTAEVSHVEAAYATLAGVDVIHDHTLLGPLVASCAPYAEIPVVTTAHGRFTPDLAAHYRLVARRAVLVTISHSQRAEIPDVPATVIHHGIDVDAIRFGEGDGGYALFVGRMSPDKGVHLAIDAARAAGVSLRIAAKMWEPDEVAYYEQEVKPRLGPDVSYLGVVTPAQRAVLMARASVLVNPICWPEPFGLVMIEALAAGTPVVALRNGAAPEIIDHGVTGYLSRGVDELPLHLRAAQQLDRRTCRAAVRHRFSAERMVHDHLRLFSQVMAGGPAPRTRHRSSPPSLTRT